MNLILMIWNCYRIQSFKIHWLFSGNYVFYLNVLKKKVYSIYINTIFYYNTVPYYVWCAKTSIRISACLTWTFIRQWEFKSLFEHLSRTGIKSRNCGRCNTVFFKKGTHHVIKLYRQPEDKDGVIPAAFTYISLG